MVLEQTIPNQQTFWKGYTSLKGKNIRVKKLLCWSDITLNLNKQRYSWINHTKLAS